MTFAKSLSLSLVAALLSSAALAADWPQWRGPNADGISPETGINKDWKANAPKQLWKVDLSDDGYAGPAVANGHVFIVDHKDKNDVVRCFDLTKGEETWKFAYPNPSGKNYGWSRSTPAIDGGKVYVMSDQAQVYCVDEKTGEKVWATDLAKEVGAKPPQWKFAGSPVIDGNSVLVAAAGKNAAVAALDKSTGKVQWSGGPSTSGGYSTPVVATIDGKKQIVVFAGTALVGLDEKGQTLWQFPWQTQYDVNAATPIVIGDSIFISSGYGHGCALVEVKGDKATKAWENNQMQCHFSTPICYKGNIYGATDSGEFICLDPKTGKSLWRQKGFEKGAAVGIDGVAIAMNGGGGDVVMIELSPDGYKELGRLKPLGGQSWTAPIVADGKLIVRNTKAMACLEIK